MERRALAVSVSAGLVAFVAGDLVESRVLVLRRAPPGELAWISDVVITCAVVVTTYLWLHLRTSLTRVEQLERHQIAVDEQLRMAAEIQQQLLPPVPASTPGFLWAARMVPAGRIGGDFYDFLPSGDGVVIAILGDASGKGVPAALTQASVKTLFRVSAIESRDPALLARRVSNALYDESTGSRYATGIVARVESDPPRLTYVNAGHPAGLLLRGDSARQLETGGPPLGLLQDASYEKESIALRPGDLGVFVSDGISEALEGMPLTVTEALQLRGAREAARRAPADLCEFLLRAASRAGGPPGVEGWEDDQTTLVFRVEAVPGQRP